MDTRELFKKYIDHVGSTEGTWCFNTEADKEHFTGEERRFIEEIIEEICLNSYKD